jgi:hypothetical protein
MPRRRHAGNLCVPAGLVGQEAVATRSSIEDRHDSRLRTRDLGNQAAVTRVVGHEQTAVYNATDARRDSHDLFTVKLVTVTRHKCVAIDIDRGLGHRLEDTS